MQGRKRLFLSVCINQRHILLVPLPAGWNTVYWHVKKRKEKKNEGSTLSD